MPLRIRCGALTLALLTAAPAASAASVDCWLLEGSALSQAHAQGLCQDAFSRNSRSGEPPTIMAPAAPTPAKKPSPPEAKAKRTAARVAKAPPTETAPPPAPA